MNNKKIVAGLLALTFVFGGTALPNTVVNSNAVISASAAEKQVRYGDYAYKLLEDGTVEIVRYLGSDKNVKVLSKINGVAVTSIGDGAFSGIDVLEKIEIPDSVTNIGSGAFAGCHNLEKIEIPDSVTSIGSNAFISCINLESVTLSKNLRSIKGATFNNCKSLKYIVIPDGIENIEGAAFLDCKSLESITLPDSVKELGDAVFVRCESLTDVKLSKNLESIGNSAFAVCSSLEEITIPSKITSISELLFGDCLNLKSVTIPATVTEIGENAFSSYDPETEIFTPLNDLVVKCYKDSAAHKYVLKSGNRFKVIDANGSKTKYPVLIKQEYNAIYRQFRVTWTEVEGAEEYGIAVKLAGKWRIQARTNKTTFTSPKLSSGQSYQLLICAKVNGKWDTSNITKMAFNVIIQ